MHIEFHKFFLKQLKKLPKHIQLQFHNRLELFIDDQIHPLLHVHTLTGEKYPHESMNINADYRALFIRNANGVTFFEIGTHSQLYKK